MDRFVEASAIRSARKSIRLSVSRASNLVGISPATLKRWEAGSGLPKRLELHQYLDGIGIASDSTFRTTLEQGKHQIWDDQGAHGERPLLRILRSRRRQLGLTLQDVSDASGLSLASIYRYETGSRTPEPTVLRILGGASGLTISEIDLVETRLQGKFRLDRSKILSDSFLVANENSQLEVFSHLDQLGMCAQTLDSDLWQTVHGLVLMGDHGTIAEVWPRIRDSIDLEKVNPDVRTLLHSTLLLVKTSSLGIPVEASQLSKLRGRIFALESSESQAIGLFQMARLAAIIEDWNSAEDWITCVQNLGSKLGNVGMNFVAELNLHAFEFQRSRSQSSLNAVQHLLSNSQHPIHSYIANVAIAQMTKNLGDRSGFHTAVLESTDSESQYGYGSPLLQKMKGFGHHLN